MAASANAAIASGLADSLRALVTLRFLVGFFLAGVYPVGMKIAAGWYARGLGRALGLLVGALVLGTVFPHLLRAVGSDLGWRTIIIGVSAIAVFGGWLPFLLGGSQSSRPVSGRGAASVITVHELTDLASSCVACASSLARLVAREPPPRARSFTESEPSVGAPW